MMMRLLFFFVIITFMACQPEPDNLKLLDQLVVSTNYDTEADFTEYTTYALATDTIGFISNRVEDTILVTPEDGDLPRSILSQVETNMNQAGYTRVNRTENPDMVVHVLIVNDINFFQEVVYPGYYYPYGYGYGYGYGSYYYNYPYVNTYVNNTGSLVVEIVDLKNPSGNTVKVIWTAYMGDIVSTVDRIKQSVEAVDQAFIQSPYLHK